MKINVEKKFENVSQIRFYKKKQARPQITW